MKRPILLVLALVAGAAVFDGAALAKGRGSVRDRLTMTPQAFDGRARLRVRRDAPDRQEIRLQVQGAADVLDLRVFVDDAAGVITEVGTMTESGAGEYMWRVRTKKGDALPFGQSDLSGLSGRAIEVRTAAGEIAFSSAFPVIRAAKAPAHTKRALTNHLAVDRSVAGAIGAPGLAASTEISLRRGGRQRFGVRVANAVTGQTFGVWIEDPVTGEMRYLSSITVGAPLAKSALAESDDADADDADDDAVDDGDDDADDDSDDGEDEDMDDGEIELDTDDGDELPEGAESVSDLAGLGVEIRTESGEVVAEGEIPSVGGADAREDDDDHDGVEDGDEDEGDDDADDDDADDVEDEVDDDAAGL